MYMPGVIPFLVQLCKKKSKFVLMRQVESLIFVKALNFFVTPETD